MRKLFKYFKPYLLLFFVLLLFVWGQSYVNLILPDYTARIVNDGISQGNISTVWSVGIKMLIVTFLGGLITIVIGFLAAKISTGFARRLREATFTKVEKFSLNELDAFSSSSLITRTTNDIQQIQNIMAMLMRMTLLAPLMGIGAVVKSIRLAPEMSLITFGAICFLIVMIVILFRAAIPKFTLIQQIVDQLGLRTREMLEGVRVIRAYDKDDEQQIKFDYTNQESTALNIAIGRLTAMVYPVMTLVMGMAAVAVVWFGAYLIDADKLNIGNVVALMQYISQAIFSFFMFSIVFVMIPRAAVSARRINEVLAVIPKINDPASPQSLPLPVRGLIEFKKVSFSYQGSEQPILDKITFTARPGQMTAIVGGTGSGKSTLLNLIPRLHDITNGSIMLDGIDIRHITQHELRRFIGYIPQKASLFSGTAKSNIAYGLAEVDSSEVDKAARLAQAAEFIDTWPKKMENPIAQGGQNISGGQKQRLSIARALAKKAPVILFDDSFSALDYRTDAALRQALKKELTDTTVIIVAQRISTIMQADNIIVLENGKIVGQGRHQDLLIECRIYREIAESQLSVSELNPDQ